MKKTKEFKIYLDLFKNDPKSVFFTANEITKSLLKKGKMGPYNKDDVFVKL